MDLMEGTATAVIKAPEDVKRKQCEILESCCGSDGIPSLEKVFGIHVILESGQEFTCSDVDCRRKTVPGGSGRNACAPIFDGLPVAGRPCAML